MRNKIPRSDKADYCRRFSFDAAILQLGVLAVLLSLGNGVAQAEDSWLKKGLKIFNKGGEENAALSIDDISAGLKDALKVGTEKVVGQLGAADGFNGDSAIRILLPNQLATAKEWLDKVGLGDSLNDLEVQLNRAAEAATPKAKELFVTAIAEMTIEDARQIYNGPDNAATEYFKSKMSGPLTEQMRPVVSESLSQVGAVQNFENIMEDYRSIPFAPDVKADLTEHAIERGLEGIFYYLGREEAAIRANPAARTTELLKKVFGAKN